MPGDAPHPMLAPLLRQGGAAARWLAAGQASAAWGEGIGQAWQQTLALRAEPWPGLLALPLGAGDGALATALQHLVAGADEAADEPAVDADAAGRGRRRAAAAPTPPPADGRAAAVVAGRPAPPTAGRGAARPPGPISALQAAAVLAQRAAAAGLAQAAQSLLPPAASTLDLSRWQLGAALAGALDRPAADAARPPGLAQALANSDMPWSSSMGALGRAMAQLAGGTDLGGADIAGAGRGLVQGGQQAAGGTPIRRAGPSLADDRQGSPAADAGQPAGGFGFDGSIAQAVAGAQQALRGGGFLGSIAQAVADAQRQADPAPSRGLGGLRGLAARAAAAGAAAAGAATAAVAAGGGLGAALGGAAAGAAGAAESGRGADAAGCGPCDMDDEQLALQLARVLRREAERDGIDVDDVQP